MTLPSSTWAVRVHEHGGPGALVYEEHPLPDLGPDDVLVEVDTASVTGEQRLPGPIPITAFDLTSRELTVVGVRGARHRDALAALALLGQGRLHTPIAARFPLAQAVEAHELLENNTDLAGLVVLKGPNGCATSDREKSSS